MISTLYIVYDPNKNNIYKIGETIDLEKRIKQYRTYIPKIEIKFSIKTQYASQIEDIILRDFYDFREKKEDGLPTEWINKPLNEIINKIIYYTNNLSLFENINNENNCKWILKSGPNKGLNCGVKISENGFCKTHSSKINKEDNPKIESNYDLTKINKEEIPKPESNYDSAKLNKEEILKSEYNHVSSNSQKYIMDEYINKIDKKENMKWLKENNCPWDNDIFETGLQLQNIEIPGNNNRKILYDRIIKKIDTMFDTDGNKIYKQIESETKIEFFRVSDEKDIIDIKILKS